MHYDNPEVTRLWRIVDDTGNAVERWSVTLGPLRISIFDTEEEARLVAKAFGGPDWEDRFPDSGMPKRFLEDDE